MVPGLFLFQEKEMDHALYVNVEEKQCPECNGILQVFDEWEICESCGRSCFNRKKMLRKPCRDRPEPATCGRCGNIYRIEWLFLGIDYNDFGDRYCPYCGDHTSLF